MYDLLLEYYSWIRAVHIMAVISWMAGLFYLPRLFVYHTRVDVGSDQDKLFQLMEYKLLKVIMNPAMVVTWLLGLALLATPGVAPLDQLWVQIKLSSVVVMSGFHMYLGALRKEFAAGINQHTESFYRKINEVPTLLMVVIVIMVVVRPWSG